MNRQQFYAQMGGEGTLDYEFYLNTKTLLTCQIEVRRISATPTNCSFRSFTRSKNCG